MHIFSALHWCLSFLLLIFFLGCGGSQPTKPRPGPPVISPIPDQRIDPGGHTLPLDLDDFVVDPDDADADILWSVGGNSRIAVTIDAEHHLVLTAPSDGWEGTEAITLTATDHNGLSASLSVRVIVARNRPPSISRTILPKRFIATWEEGFLPIRLDDIVEDPDNTDAEMTWRVSGTSHLQISTDKDRVMHIVPLEPQWLGSEIVTLTATDPGGLADSLSLTIGMGPRPPTGKVYVANSAPYKAGYGNPTSGEIMEIDIATNTVVRSFPAGDIPFCLVPSPDGQFLYVVNRGLEYHPDTHIAASRIWTIDLSTGEKVGDVSVKGKNPGWLALHPDGRTAYVVVSVKQGKESIPQGQEGILQGVVGIDLISGEITSKFPLRGYPVGLCTTPDRSRLFVTNVGIIEGPRLTGAPLSLIDTGTGNTAEIDLKDTSYGICLSPDDRTAYVTKPYQGLVQVIDVINGTLIANIQVTGSSQWITRSPDGKRLYVVVKKRYKTAEEPNSLVTIDTATNTVTQVIEVGPGPEGVALTAEGRFIYVTNRNYIHGAVTQGSVTAIDAVDNTVIATIPAGEEPIAICTVTGR